MRTSRPPPPTHISGLIRPLHLPTPVIGLHAARLVTKVGVLLARHAGRRARVGGGPGHMVFHCHELLHGTPRPNCSRKLLSRPASFPLLPYPLSKQARPEAEARGGGVGAGGGGGEDGGGSGLDDLSPRFWAAAPFGFANLGGASFDVPKQDQVAAGDGRNLIFSTLSIVIIIIVVVVVVSAPLGGARVVVWWWRRSWGCGEAVGAGAGGGDGGKRRAHEGGWWWWWCCCCWC